MAKRLYHCTDGSGLDLSQHPITVWAGVILLRLCFEWIKLREELSEALVGFTKAIEQSDSVRGSNAESWFYGLALGPSDLTILADIGGIGCWESC
jgi:hypothetical protein